MDRCFGANQICESRQTCPSLDFQFPSGASIQREIAGQPHMWNHPSGSQPGKSSVRGCAYWRSIGPSLVMERFRQSRLRLGTSARTRALLMSLRSPEAFTVALTRPENSFNSSDGKRAISVSVAWISTSAGYGRTVPIEAFVVTP